MCDNEAGSVSLTSLAAYSVTYQVITERGYVHITNNWFIEVAVNSIHLNTERTYKWKLSGSAHQSEIGILCFDWLIHPGVSYSREI